jgi:hypothetical protein
MIRMLSNPKGRRRWTLAAVAAVAAAVSVALSPGAHAATLTARPALAAGQAHTTTVIRVTRPMRVVGFDAAVARAHGFTVRTNAEGKPYITKDGTAAVAPDDQVEGACGLSWVDYKAIGERSQSPRYVAVLSTGYAIDAATYGLAYEGSWVVSVGDNAGTGDVTFENPVGNGASWSGSEDTYHSVTGYSIATVLTSKSFVVTDEGYVCYSGGPYASTELYG